MTKYIFATIVLIIVVSINTYSQCGMMGSGSHQHGKKETAHSTDEHDQPLNLKGYAFINDDGMQEATILIKKGYQPDTLVVKKGIPLRLKFDLQEKGCTDKVVLRTFKIEQKLEPFKITTIEFTPDSAGTFTFSCPMEMIEGTLVVKK